MELMEEQPKNSMEGDGVLKRSPPAGKDSRSLLPGLQTADLADTLRVQQLWRIASGRGLIPETSYWRETFFGLCWSIYRRRHEESIRNPVGLLHSKLRQGRDAILRQVDDETDRAWARRAIAELDGVQLATPRSAAADPEAAALHQQQRWRSEQARALYEAIKRGEFGREPSEVTR